jgi:hypothetical protein
MRGALAEGDVDTSELQETRSEYDEHLLKEKRESARGQLIRDFEAKQAQSCEFLSFSQIAKHWAPHRSESTLKAAKDAALEDLMEAAYDGHFPSMLLLRPETGVEYVPEVGGDLDRDAYEGSLFDPSLADEATPYLDPAQLNELREMGELREPVERDLLHHVAPNLWIARDLAVSFLRKRGVASFPDAWLSSHDVQDASQGAPDYNVMERRGKGKVHTLVFNAMEEIWPDRHVPRNLSIKEIERKIEKGLQQRDIKRADDEIRRILGLKK